MLSPELIKKIKKIHIKMGSVYDFARVNDYITNGVVQLL